MQFGNLDWRMLFVQVTVFGQLGGSRRHQDGLIIPPPPFPAARKCSKLQLSAGAATAGHGRRIRSRGDPLPYSPRVRRGVNFSYPPAPPSAVEVKRKKSKIFIPKEPGLMAWPRWTGRVGRGQASGTALARRCQKMTVGALAFSLLPARPGLARPLTRSAVAVMPPSAPSASVCSRCHRLRPS